MVHLLLIAVALSFKKKLPVLTFGLLFYYLALAIESTIIPITDLAFEHRTYLPNVGLVIALFAVVACLANKAIAAKITDTKIVASGVLIPAKLPITLMLVFIIVCSFLSYLTHSRVTMWADEKLFYQNEVKLSPKSPRAYTELANIYSAAGNCPLAIGMSEHAINLYENQRQSSLGVQPEFYQNYISCLRQLKIFDKADYFEKYLLTHVKEPIRRSAILFQRGTFMLSQHKFKQAEHFLTTAIKLNGKNHATAINLAITKVQLGKYTHAVKLLQHAIALKPNDQSIREMLANLQATLNQ
jgi:tetratricopeptide (TPR) repeat protein